MGVDEAGDEEVRGVVGVRCVGWEGRGREDGGEDGGNAAGEGRDCDRDWGNGQVVVFIGDHGSAGDQHDCVGDMVEWWGRVRCRVGVNGV